jgi:hypothetical protein
MENAENALSSEFVLPLLRAIPWSLPWEAGFLLSNFDAEPRQLQPRKPEPVGLDSSSQNAGPTEVAGDSSAEKAPPEPSQDTVDDEITRPQIVEIAGNELNTQTDFQRNELPHVIPTMPPNSNDIKNQPRSSKRGSQYEPFTERTVTSGTMPSLPADVSEDADRTSTSGQD